MDTDKSNCLNLFFNSLDPIYVSYTTTYMEIEKKKKKDVHCQLDGSSNYTKQDFNSLREVALACRL